jgi:exoribonuclease R
MAAHPIYQIIISDREYTSWSFVNPVTNSPKSLSESETLVNPAHLKIFSGDLVDLSSPIPVIRESPIKHAQIPGLLILEGNQTYGRTANNKRNFYKCIPSDKHLPAFLIPYSPEITFSKILKNRFVVFRFDNWNTKHPQGILTENIGEVDNLSAFYEYQLYCKNIHYSITEFNAATKKATNDMSLSKCQNPHFFYPSSMKSTLHIFSIDPAGTKDIDDAFSIFIESPFVIVVRIYIANVFAWMETLDLWSAFGERVSTIYLPDSKRPMLPAILTDTICSLTADKTHKPAFCMEVKIDTANNKIMRHSARVFNQSIIVDKNYSYETAKLLADPDYQLLYKYTKLIDNSVEDSHDVVSFWMIYMNSYCGERLHNKSKGIYRQVLRNKEEDPEPPLEGIPPKTRQFLRIWNSDMSGEYVVLSQNNTAKIQHDGLNTTSYVHITSPIRRLVDLLNQAIYQKEFGLVDQISDAGEDFLRRWTADIDKINWTMKQIRKVQTNCDLLFRCYAHPEWMQHPHRGIIVGRVEKTNGTYSYTVYLSELNILGKVTTQEKYVIYSVMQFRIYMFQNADKLTRKIRFAVDSGSI